VGRKQPTIGVLYRLAIALMLSLGFWRVENRYQAESAAEQRLGRQQAISVWAVKLLPVSQ
jgi:high-affinity Fe2+/Pb2+ permease